MACVAAAFAMMDDYGSVRILLDDMIRYYGAETAFAFGWLATRKSFL